MADQRHLQGLAVAIPRNKGEEHPKADQAQVLVAALRSSAAHCAQTWPPLLAKLNHWANGLRRLDTETRAVSDRPLRPWERQTQQQTQNQQQQQKDQQACNQVLLRQALLAVAAGLQAACAITAQDYTPHGSPLQDSKGAREAKAHDHTPAAASVDEAVGAAAFAAQGAAHSHPAAAQELLAMCSPAITFLASAAAAATGPDATELLQQAAAAACAAAAAAVPMQLHYKPDDLQKLLWSYQQLMLASKDNPVHVQWLLGCLLAAMEQGIPGSCMQQQQQLLQQQRRRQQRDMWLTTSLQAWGQQQAAELAAVNTAHLLTSLYTVGRKLGHNLCSAAARAAIARLQQQHTIASSTTVVDSLCGITQLLLGACTDGSELLSAVAGATAAGMVAGCLEAVAAVGAAAPSTAVAADADPDASTVEGVWASTVAAGGATKITAAATGAASTKTGLLRSHRQHHKDGRARMPSSSSSGVQQQEQEQLLQPTWLQQLERQVLLLHHVAMLACKRCVQRSSTNTGQSPPAPATSAAGADAIWLLQELLLGYAISKLTSSHGAAVHKLQQQQRRRQYACAHTRQLQSVLLCSFQYIQRQCCTLAGVLHHAGMCADAAAANTWLTAQQQQHTPHEVGMLARWLAGAVGQLRHADLPAVYQTLRASGEKLAQDYSVYLQAAPAAALQAVNAAAARQQLDRVFALHVMVLEAAWQAQQQRGADGLGRPATSNSSSAATLRPTTAHPTEVYPSVVLSVVGDTQGSIVAEGLADLAALQFCQVQLSSYVDLLRSLITTLASSNTDADAFVSSALPCYDVLVQPVAGQLPSWMHKSQAKHAPANIINSSSVTVAANSAAYSSGIDSSDSLDSSMAVAWLHDPVLVAQLSFLVPLLPVACNAASDQAAAVQASIPLLLLLLPHPAQQLSQAAHSAVAGLLKLAIADAAGDASAVAVGLQQNFHGRKKQVAADSTSADRCNMQEWQQQQQHFDALKKAVEQAIPMYLHRSLDALPLYGSLEGFTIGFNCILRDLQPGSGMPLLAIKLVASKALEVAAAKSAHSSSCCCSNSSTWSKPGQQQLQSQGNTAAGAAAMLSPCHSRLFELLQQAVHAVDFHLLPSTLQLVADAVLAAPAAVQQEWLLNLYSSCLAVDDYARKPALITWTDDLAKQVMAVQQQQPARVHAQVGNSRALQAAGAGV